MTSEYQGTNRVSDFLFFVLWFNLNTFGAQTGGGHSLHYEISHAKHKVSVGMKQILCSNSVMKATEIPLGCSEMLPVEFKMSLSFESVFPRIFFFFF